MRITLAAVLAALLIAAAPAAAQTTTDVVPTLAADGIGSATLTPDIADFGAAVRRTAPTAAKARRSVNSRVNAMVAAAKARGIAEADIQTQYLSVSRERYGRKGHRKTRYNAAQWLQFRSRDVKTLGAVIDAVTAAGADDVAAPSFGFADPSQGRLLATRAAIADATKRANDAAAQAGLRITGVRTLDLDPQASQLQPEYSADSAASGRATPEAADKAPETTVRSGTQEFTAYVRMTFLTAPL